MTDRISSKVQFAVMSDGSVVIHQRSELGCDQISVATIRDFQSLINEMQEFHDKVVSVLPAKFPGLGKH